MFNILSYFLSFSWPSAGVWAWNCSNFENNPVTSSGTRLSWAQVLESPSLVFSFVSWCSSFFASNSLLDLSPGYYHFFCFMMFIFCQQFSIGFKSRLLPGQSSTLIFCCWRKFVTFLDLWHGVSSCMKTSQLWMWNILSMCSSSTFTYWSLFIFLFLGKKYRPALPISPEKAPHTMIESGCFTVGTVNLGSNLFESWGRRTIGDPTRNTWKLLSSENITLFHCAGVKWMYFFCKCNALLFHSFC